MVKYAPVRLDSDNDEEDIVVEAPLASVAAAVEEDSGFTVDDVADVEPEQAVKEGPTSRVVLEIKNGQISSPRVEGEKLKKREIVMALALAAQLIVQKVYDSHKGELY